MIDTSNSILWEEIHKQPESIEACLNKNLDLIKKIAKEVNDRKIKTVVFVGRGSSDHANLVGRYLFETYCGFVASISAPSVVTAYNGNIDYSNVLMISVSQSGGAEDIYRVMKKCDEDGGICVCVTNTPKSRMTEAGKYHIYNGIGKERSITAAKSYLTQVLINTALAAYISGNKDLLKTVKDSKKLVEKAIKVVEPQVFDIVKYFRNTEHMLIFGRGLMDAIGNEAELKIQETSYLDARCYGSADYRHGPVATSLRFVPCIFFIADKATDYCAVDLHKRLKEETNIWSAIVTNKKEIAEMADASVLLPKEFDGVYGMWGVIIFSQMFACLCSLSRGFDPDNPKGVSKKTVTI